MRLLMHNQLIANRLKLSEVTRVRHIDHFDDSLVEFEESIIARRRAVKSFKRHATAVVFRAN